jgi:hypothetical protein
MPRYRHPNTGSTIDTTEADFATTWAAKGFVLDDGTAAEGAEPIEDAAPNLDAMKRDELDAYAAERGVADPGALPNKQAVIDAIGGGSGGAGGERDAEGAVDEHGRPV